MKKILVSLAIVLIANSFYAQEIKFGKVSKAELEETVYPGDSVADAAILYKSRKTYFRFTKSVGFQVVTEILERRKIYTSEGFDYATKFVPYYSGSSKSSVSRIKAYTYNLENGKIVKTSLEKGEIFDEETSKYWSQKKFTMPNIKEGCVVEWKYSVTSNRYGVQDVQFQYSIPVKRIVASVETPEYFIFKKSFKGYYPAYPKTERKNRQIVFSDGTLDYLASKDSYDLRNVPALYEESYVSNIRNYLTTIEYELSEVHMPREPIEYYSHTWDDVVKTFYKNIDYKEKMNKSGHFSDDLDVVLASAKTQDQKIVAIFEFVKQKIKWNDYNGISDFHGTRKAYKEGVGNVSDINMNLVAMLKKAGFKANPVILSTRSHGIPLYPTIDGFNYVIAAVELEEQLVLLDATDINSTPNNLPLRTINWEGTLIRENGSSTKVNLVPSTPSTTTYNLNLTLNEDGEIEGMVRNTYSNFGALEYRTENRNLKDEDIISNKEEEIGSIEIGDFRINNKKDPYKPLTEMYKFYSEDLIEEAGNKIYLKPLLFKSKTENPFKLEKREYPIDFGSPFVEKVNIRLSIPKGYTVESIPESIAIGLSNDMGSYRFKVTVSGNTIVVFSQIEIKTAVYPSTNYDEIKEFYKTRVNKNLESLVLVKS